jgi:hypothetical protein
MKKETREPATVPLRRLREHECAARGVHSDAQANTAVNTPSACDATEDMEARLPPLEATPSLATESVDAPPPRKVARGLTTSMSTKQLKDGIWLRALLIANRFRVFRTIDVAVACFPERSFKAALTASQRAMRGLNKAKMIGRFRSDRFQTICGLRQGGVDWLAEAGFEAASSVRRVSDMSNPEHRLWAQFWVLCCEARGLTALTEQELLRALNKGIEPGGKLIQGMLTVTMSNGKHTGALQPRPDAICREENGRDTTWLEVDRSLRGAARSASLRALCGAVGSKLTDGTVLRRVVVFCKSDRIQKRALAVLHGLARTNNHEVLASVRRHFREVEPGMFEVWAARKSKLKDGRSELVDTLDGHVIIQLLPTWLPRVRIDSKNTFSMAGWFGENYLPYRRPASMPPWRACTSPLLTPIA